MIGVFLQVQMPGILHAKMWSQMFSLHRDLERVWWEVGGHGHGFLLEEQKQALMVKISKLRSDFRVSSSWLRLWLREKGNKYFFAGCALLLNQWHNICRGAKADLPLGLVHEGSNSEAGTFWRLISVKRDGIKGWFPVYLFTVKAAHFKTSYWDRYSDKTIVFYAASEKWECSPTFATPDSIHPFIFSTSAQLSWFLRDGRRCRKVPVQRPIYLS